MECCIVTNFGFSFFMQYRLKIHETNACQFEQPKIWDKSKKSIFHGESTQFPYPTFFTPQKAPTDGDAAKMG